MTASAVVLLTLLLVIFTQMSSTNIILECISLLYCNGKVPVCGTNGTHCWQSESDCERAKFNCLQLYKEDFEKVDLRYCDNLTIGGIKECCMPKSCSNKKEDLCAENLSKSTKTVPSKCRWFKNRCEMRKHNCEHGTTFMKTKDDQCGFAFESEEQSCTNSKITPS